MIRFVPEMGRGNTDPSYHLPAFYELWSRWGPKEDRAFWAKAADVSRDLFNRVKGPETGLTPDQAHFDGGTAIGMGWEADAVQLRLMAQREQLERGLPWWRKDPRETVLSDRIQKFLYGQGIDKFVDRYTLDGKPLSDRHSIGMLATTAVGSQAATDGPSRKRLLRRCGTRPRRAANNATTTACFT